MNLIEVYYTYIIDFLPQEEFNFLLGLLPESYIEINHKYKFQKDKHSNLLGKLILLKALKDKGCNASILQHIKYSEYKRPFLPDFFDFNISHAEKMVVLAIAQRGKVGIDIENFRTVELENFKSTMDNQQWEKIITAESPEYEFFRLWTRKESLSKAIGKGLYIDFKKLSDTDIFEYEGSNWFTYQLKTNSNYIGHITTQGISKIKYHFVDFYTLSTFNK